MRKGEEDLEISIIKVINTRVDAIEKKIEILDGKIAAIEGRIYENRRN